MINRIRNLLFSADTAALDPSDQEAPEAAAAALLVEAALVDGTFDDGERKIISKLLVDRFELSAEDVESVIGDAEARVTDAVELHGFTRRANAAFDHDGRIELIEMLWEVVYADGVVHDYEANLVRRLSGLLHVSDRDSGAARKRVVARLDIA